MMNLFWCLHCERIVDARDPHVVRSTVFESEPPEACPHGTCDGGAADMFEVPAPLATWTHGAPVSYDTIAKHRRDHGR